MMSQMSQTPLHGRDRTTAEAVERIALETASLPNRLAWTEILAKLRAAGRSSSQANQLRDAVWAVRKQNSAAKRPAAARRTP
jgi:hypothetical protein